MKKHFFTDTEICGGFYADGSIFDPNSNKVIDVGLNEMVDCANNLPYMYQYKPSLSSQTIAKSENYGLFDKDSLYVTFLLKPDKDVITLGKVYTANKFSIHLKTDVFIDLKKRTGSITFYFKESGGSGGTAVVVNASLSTSGLPIKYQPAENDVEYWEELYYPGNNKLFTYCYDKEKVLRQYNGLVFQSKNTHEVSFRIEGTLVEESPSSYFENTSIKGYDILLVASQNININNYNYMKFTYEGDYKRYYGHTIYTPNYYALPPSKKGPITLKLQDKVLDNSVKLIPTEF